MSGLFALYIDTIPHHYEPQDDEIPISVTVQEALGSTQGGIQGIIRTFDGFPDFLKTGVNPMSLQQFDELNIQRQFPDSRVIRASKKDKVYAYFVIFPDIVSGRYLQSVYYVSGEIGINLLEKFTSIAIEKYGINCSCENYNTLLNYLLMRRGC